MNPLVIIELTGNLHFEALSIFFVLLSFWLLIIYPSSKNKLILSAISISAATLIKLLPLIFIPLIINKIGWKKEPIFLIIVAIVIFTAFVPFFDNQVIQNISQSLDLYFQKFEFNASIYNLVKFTSIFFLNNNPIQLAGPVLSIIGFILILYISFEKNRLKTLDNQLFTTALAVLSIYFIAATTVHPWYLTSLVAFCIFTKFRFPIVWSGLAFLSYSAYQYTDFHENFWLISIEYILVFGVIIFEIRKLRISQKRLK